MKSVTLVVNFDLPNEPEAYIHRIGRTGRAGETGYAAAFCSPEEREQLRDIEKLIQQTIPVDATHNWHLAALAERHVRGGGTGVPRGAKKPVSGTKRPPRRRRGGPRRRFAA